MVDANGDFIFWGNFFSRVGDDLTVFQNFRMFFLFFGNRQKCIEFFQRDRQIRQRLKISIRENMNLNGHD
ncbi:hypothetical protein [Allobaculum sp. Allo2]|uniref:hypothetical protein n=1 Tax=Allobaculum sp. Allo2 TaxID=2853432 RepID=UPI001F5FFD37|nr:hypothetical protein [Allobaculum sp. Allo2]UNT94395.1 hypothetical protein KWG61_07420 [Allobaculum sp. Allo2]